MNAIKDQMLLAHMMYSHVVAESIMRDLIVLKDIRDSEEYIVYNWPIKLPPLKWYSKYAGQPMGALRKTFNTFFPPVFSQDTKNREDIIERAVIHRNAFLHGIVRGATVFYIPDKRWQERIGRVMRHAGCRRLVRDCQCEGMSKNTLKISADDYRDVFTDLAFLEREVFAEAAWKLGLRYPGLIVGYDDPEYQHIPVHVFVGEFPSRSQLD